MRLLRPPYDGIRRDGRRRRTPAAPAPERRGRPTAPAPPAPYPEVPLIRRLLAGGLLAALIAVLAAPAAWAQSGTYLRLAHLSPDTPAVDVLVTSYSGETLRLDGVGYGDISTYQRIEPGGYTVQMRPAGAPESTPPVVSATLDAQPGAAYTAAGLGPNADLAVRVLDDDLTLPAAGQARLRVIQGAQDAGTVTIGWQGGTPLADIAFADATGYVDVPAGSGAVTVTPAGGPPVDVPVGLEPGSVHSLVLTEVDGELSGNLQTDATGTGEVPVGGVDTGLGGAALVGGDGGVFLVVGLLAVTVLGSLVAMSAAGRRGSEG